MSIDRRNLLVYHARELIQRPPSPGGLATATLSPYCAAGKAGMRFTAGGSLDDFEVSKLT